MKGRAALLTLTTVLFLCEGAGAVWQVPMPLTVAAVPRDEPAAGRQGKRAEADGSGRSSPKKGAKKKSGKKRRKKVDMAAVSADEKAEQAALAALGEGFHLERRRHFSVVHDTGEQDVKTFGVAIEKTYRSCMNYSQKLGVDVEPPKKKLLIYYFGEHADYSAYSSKLGKGELPQSMPGVYFPDLNVSLFYNYRNQESFKQARERAEARIEQLRRQLRGGNLTSGQRKDIRRRIAEARRQANSSNVVGGDVSESIVQHEVAHQVMWNVGFHNDKSFLANPRWFVEGTAMMFEPISDGKSSNFGAVNEMRKQAFRRLEHASRLIPVRDLVATHQYFGEQTAEAAYPESWALVHYLNRKKRKQVRKYVELINKRPADFRPLPEAELATFEAAFGKLDEKWVKKWRSWMKDVR